MSSHSSRALDSKLSISHKRELHYVPNLIHAWEMETIQPITVNLVRQQIVLQNSC